MTAAPRSAASEMAGYLHRNAARSAGADAITGRGDLVADVKAGRQKLATVKDDDLPDAVRALSPQQRQALIDKQLAERKQLNGRLAELLKKRDNYVANARKNAPRPKADSFDRAIEETLRVQIKR